jgi:hypothetical protein
VVLFIIHCFVDVENIRTYFSSKVQILKEKVDEQEIIEMKKKALL